MDENKKYKIAQEAKVIVSGYAFPKTCMCRVYYYLLYMLG